MKENRPKVIPEAVEQFDIYDAQVPSEDEILDAEVSIKSQMERLLKAVPGESEYSIPIATYCDRAVALATSKYVQILQNTLGQSAQPYVDRILALHVADESMPPSAIVDTDHGLRLQNENGVLEHLNILQRAVAFRNIQLGVYDPMASLKFAHENEVMQQRFPSFNDRFKRIIDGAGVDITDPRAQFIAVGYINQAGKFLARNQAITLMKRLVNTTTLLTDSPDSVDNHFAFIEQTVRSIQQLKQFIAASAAEQAMIAAENHFSEEQQQVMHDLAYMHKVAVNTSEHFSSMVDGLASYVFAQEPDWHSAIAHRDFILQYLHDSFPRWRSKSVRKSDIPSAGSLVSLKQKLRGGSILLREDDVPPLLRNLMEGHLVQYSTIDEEYREQELLMQSESLSLEMIDQITLETEMNEEGRSPVKKIGISAINIFEILISTELSNEQKKQRFAQIWRHRFTSASDNDVEEEYRYYMNKFNGPKAQTQQLIYPWGSSEWQGQRISKQCVKRIGKSSTSHTIQLWAGFGKREQGDRQKLPDLSPENHGDVKYLGRVYFKLIQFALNDAQRDPRILDRDQLLNAMRRAYSVFQKKHPEKATFRLSEYLHTMTKRAPNLERDFALHYTEILKFIQDID